MTTAPSPASAHLPRHSAQGTTMADFRATTAFRQRIDREAEEPPPPVSTPRAAVRERVNDLPDDSTFRDRLLRLQR